MSDDFNWLAVDESGEAFIFDTKPSKGDVHGVWLNEGCEFAEVKGFKSYTRGNCDWTDSLVMRPGYEGE